DVDGVERLAGRHEQSIAFAAPEADVRADLRQSDLADACAVGRKDVHAIVTIADPTGARPHIAILIAPDAVGETSLPVPFHADERLWVLQLCAIDIVDPDLALGLWIVGNAGVSDVELLVIG